MTENFQNSMSDLPKDWVETELKTIVKTRKGKKPNVLQESKQDGFIPYLDIHAIEKNVFRQYAEASTSRIGTDKDLFVVWDGARSGWVGFGKNGAIGSTIMALETIITDQTFLFYFLKSKFDYLNSNTRGTGIPHVDPQVFDSLQVPLPPLNEQKRIVAKLEALLSRVDAGRERLEKIPKILKRFRQSVLAAACSGNLTVDWRENKEINLDTNLPFGWKLETVGNVIDDLKYGTSQKCDYETKGVPVLRIPNIADFFIDQTDLKFANLPEKEFAQLKLIEGDLLLIRSNGSVSLVGKTSMVRKSDENFAYAGYLIRLRPNTELIFPEFLNFQMASFQVRLQIELPARSTSGVNNINSTEVKALEIALPPLPEQKEIVRRVEDLFKFADSIEERFKQAKAQVDKLTNSILAKAFRGELVPQDDADEPASVLLERIKAEKETNQRKALSQRKLFE